MKNSDIIKKIYRRNIIYSFSYSLLYFLIITICLSLAILFFPTLLITIPFILIPFTFSFHHSINDLNKGKKISLALFFKGYILYYRRWFYGGYRVVINFLKSFLIYLIFDVFILLIVELIYIYSNSELLNLLFSISSYSEIYDILMTNKDIELIATILFNIAILFSSLYFFFLITINSAKYSLVFHQNFVTEMKTNNAMFKLSLKYFKKTLYKQYFSNLYFVYIIYTIGYVSFSFIVYLFISKNMIYIAVFSLLFTYFLLIPAYAYIVDTIDFIMNTNLKEYMLANKKAMDALMKKFNIEK